MAPPLHFKRPFEILAPQATSFAYDPLDANSEFPRRASPGVVPKQGSAGPGQTQRRQGVTGDGLRAVALGRAVLVDAEPQNPFQRVYSPLRPSPGWPRERPRC